MKKKQIVSLLLTGVMAMSLMAGCGSNSSKETSSSSTDEWQSERVYCILLQCQVLRLMMIM